jgi:hypothetical protein
MSHHWVLQVNHLLDLRQKDANVSEAVRVRESSEDAIRQGRAVFVFTVVTIIFMSAQYIQIPS